MFFVPYEADYIKSIHLPHSRVSYKRVWNLANNGKYSTDFLIVSSLKL